MSSCKDPSQPFPSPGSSFIPPPVPGPHEFAVRHSSLPRKISKKDVNDPVPDPRSSPTCNGNTTPTATITTNGVALSSSPTSPNGVDPPSPDSSAALPPQTPSHPARDPPDVHPHHYAHDPTSPSDPQLSLTPNSHHTHHRLSSQSVTSLTSSRPAPPSPAVSRRASGLSRTSSRPVSDMSTTALSRPASDAQHPRLVSGGSSHPASGTAHPTVTPTVSTLNFLRHSHDRLPNLASTFPTSDLDPIATEQTPTPAQPTTAVTTTPALIQIRDYGFASTDPRFTGQGPHVPRANRPAILALRLASSSGSTPTSSSEQGSGDDDADDDYEDEEDGEDGRMSIGEVERMWEGVVDDGTNGWSGFKWGFSRAWGFGTATGATSGPGMGSSGAGFPSRGDLDRNFGGEGEYEDMEVDEEAEAFSDEEGQGNVESEPPLFPGIYRALYAFEPEGTAEMKLDEDQLVRVIGRGGGVGWAVVVKGGLKDMGVHALVPESYLELVRLDGEEAASDDII